MIRNNFRRKADLLWLFTTKEITLKYRRSSLGVLWSLLNPVLLSIVLFIAFKIFMKIGMENYLFFLLTALFPWNWFSASVTMSTETLVSNVNLIKLTRFPVYFLVISTILAQLFNFIFALPIIIGLAYFYAEGPGINWLIGFPLLVLSQLMVTIGICLVISIVNACFRDMEHIVGVVLSMLFWMTPVIYPLDMVPDAYRVYLALNPLTYLMIAWRDLLMSNIIDWDSIGISFGISLIFLFFGILIFRKFEKRLGVLI